MSRRAAWWAAVLGVALLGSAAVLTATSWSVLLAAHPAHLVTLGVVALVGLPSSTTYTAIRGGVHAFFGDYGARPGDGTASTSRADAQRRVVRATVDLLQAM